MGLVKKLLATPLYFVCYFLFRHRLYQQSRKKHEWVMKLFRFCADNGSRRALSVYGHLLHFRGDGVSNKIQGGIYLQRAADLGDAKAQYQMGRIFESGFELYFRADAAQARHYFVLAGEQGHALAVRRMVTAYELGELGLGVDENMAKKWRNKLPALPGEAV
ncbi:MAG: tetratricopeptide repeat protein [Pontibacterium sp.]